MSTRTAPRARCGSSRTPVPSGAAARNSYRRWFDPLDRVLRASVGASYYERGACHLDLVQRRRGPRNHDGTITTDRPDELWGTDATACLTTREDNATVFIAVDHCTQECVGIHAARPGTRFEALEPLRQGLRAHHGGYGPGVAAALSLRHNHGSQYLSDHFQGELRFLGIRSSPSFVAAPEGNGCAERFIRTLKEQLLWVEPFETVQQLRLALLAFKDRYNQKWLVERHGHRTPAAVRQALSPNTGATA